MKSLTYSETNIEIERDLETGKATKQHERKTYKVKIEQEPDFVKLYLKDICKLNNIPKTSSKLLNVLLRYSSYENKVLLPSGIKKEIVKELETTMGTLDNALSKLVKSEIIARESKGVYKLNPYIFGRGKWQDIKKIRATWSYGEEGRALSVVEIEKEIDKDLEGVVG